jgi:2-oxoglutarate dehydrogenase E1 component
VAEGQEDREGSSRESDLASVFSGEGGAYVESLFEDYLLGRSRVPESWARIFDELIGRPSPDGGNGRVRAAAEPAAPAPAVSAPAVPALAAPALAEMPAPAIGIVGLINAYRMHGHLIAKLDPLGRGDSEHALLEPSEYGIGEERMDRRVAWPTFLGLREGTPRELVRALRETYCGTFAVEFMDIRDKPRRDWLLERMEPCANRPLLGPEERREILRQVLAAERMEQLLHRRFLGQKRFSVEGADSLIPLLHAIVEGAARLGAKEMVLAMAHRGRLNVLAHVMGMPYQAVFAEFQASLMPRDAQGAGDVKYHRGYSSDRVCRSGEQIHLSLCSNPSHLEWINPIAEGIVRAKQSYRGDAGRKQVIPVQIHGDAAFNGQGIVSETLALSELESYRTGGTIHIIVNNQIGFTTNPEEYRFTRYPSDTAKVIQAPVFHVNADDPEACVHAARLAIEFRQRFGEDVIIDLVCYRRHGHNEADDPTVTQPVLYERIAEHPTAAKLYAARLLVEGVLDAAAVEALEADRRQRLERGFEESKTQIRLEGSEGYHGLWRGFHVGNGAAAQPTGAPREALDRIADALLAFPEGFEPHPKVRRVLEARARSLRPKGQVDWGTAEAAAIGSLLAEGKTVRLTGQDVERGTFGQRNAVLRDMKTDRRWVPLDALGGTRAHFLIANSPLSEAAALGFEYGYSTVDPNRLTVWEAQYGDFTNCAQVIVDQFIASSEKKWNRSSGLVMLLPHGYEGQGPEHSSARLERFLQLCAEDNLIVCNLTTAAQYFHVLRRQLSQSVRKPLVLATPKSLLRHAGTASPVEELEKGSFHTVLDDPARAEGSLDPAKVRRVLLCSGKVFYTLTDARAESSFGDVAIVRLEQLHPFPFDEVRATLAPYATRDFVWVQEEPWNMGAWSYVQIRLAKSLPQGATPRYVGRHESASPATGSYKIHLEEEAEFVREAFARAPRARTTA